MLISRKTTVSLALLAALGVSATFIPAQAGGYGKGDCGKGGYGMSWKKDGHMGKRGRMRGQFMERIKAMDTNKDGKITKEEAQAARQAAITKNDSDKSGDLNLAEFKTLWAQKNERRAVRAFQRLDTNGDGKITTAEQNEKIDRLFARADRNGDGVLSKDDMKRRWHFGKKGKGQGNQGQENRGQGNQSE